MLHRARTDQEYEVGVALEVRDLVDVRGDRLAADAHLLAVDQVPCLLKCQPPDDNALLRCHLEVGECVAMAGGSGGWGGSLGWLGWGAASRGSGSGLAPSAGRIGKSRGACHMQRGARAAKQAGDVVQRGVAVPLVFEELHVRVEQVTLGDVDPFHVELVHKLHDPLGAQGTDRALFSCCWGAQKDKEGVRGRTTRRPCRDGGLLDRLNARERALVS